MVNDSMRDDDLFRAALDASVDGHTLWEPVLDENGDLVELVCFYTNPVGAAFSGRTLGALIGSGLIESAEVAGDAPFAEQMLDVVRTGTPFRRRSRLTTQAGDEVWIDFAAVRLAGGLSISGRDATAEVLLHAQLEEANAESARQAATDPLTDLPNRRAWSVALGYNLRQAREDGLPLVVAILDLDRFKLYNDTHGHMAGDQHLRDVARMWRDHLPPDATLARIGGEEFAIALPRMTAARARELLTELCQLVPHDETSSAGLTVWDGAEDARSLLGRADAALYAAKHAGRDRVEALLPLPLLNQ